MLSGNIITFADTSMLLTHAHPHPLHVLTFLLPSMFRPFSSACTTPKLLSQEETEPVDLANQQ